MTHRSTNSQPFSRVGSDILKLALAAAGVQGVALLALPFLQRYFYTPEAFADFALYSQLAGLLGAVATARMDLAVVQHKTQLLARAALQNGLKALALTTAISLVLALGLKWGGMEMGKVPYLWIALPLGVTSLGMGALFTAWLSRDKAFGAVAQYRAIGGTTGELLRFATARLGHTGLIVGRVLGQWFTALLAWRAFGKDASPSFLPSAANRREAWAMDKDYLRFTTPSNLLAMAANACLVLFLFECASRDFVGQVGTALAYLTAASGLLIRSVNDVFFRHLKDIAPAVLPGVYMRWALGIAALTATGCLVLFAIPTEMVTHMLGTQWSNMLPAMRWLSLWMIPWVAASSLSGIFPHLRRQSLAFGLDVLHLILIVGWLWLNWSPLGSGNMAYDSMDILKEYACIQAGFYTRALALGWSACLRGAKTQMPSVH